MPPKSEAVFRSKRNITPFFVVAAVAVLGALAFFFLGGTPKGAAIDIEAPEKAALGEPFDLSVVFRNESESEMRDVTISLNLPKGVSLAEGDGEARSIRNVGDVVPGGVARESFRLMVSEGADSEKALKAEADYIPGGVSQHISINKEVKVKIQKPVSASIEFPEKVVSGEEFDWIVTFTNNSEADTEVKVTSEVSRDLTTNFKTFEIDVPKGEEKKKKFSGSVVLAEGEPFSVKISLSGMIRGETYLFDEVTAASTVAPSPLSIKTEVKGKGSDYVASPGERIDYAVTVKNNSDVPLQNVLIRSALKGDMYDIDSITSNGNVDKGARVVIWDMSNDGRLRELAPGSEASFDISVSLKSDYTIRRLSDRNFSLELATRAESPTVPYLVKSLKTVNISSFKTKVAGRLSVEAHGYFRDAASGIINEGELPLTVGNSTEATVHWIVSSYATDMQDVEIRAELPSGVDLTGDKKVDVGELSYDKDRGEVIWRIPKVLATTGVLSKPIEAIFQVKIVPLSAHTGGYMAIMGDTSVFATDVFTGQKIQGGAGPVTTEFKDDRTVGPNDGIVR